MNDTCYFCKGKDACYGRRDESGKYQNACFDCAKKPYPVPKQFQKTQNFLFDAVDTSAEIRADAEMAEWSANAVS